MLPNRLFLLVLLGLCSELYCVGNGSTADNSVCKRIKATSDVGKKGFLCIGKMAQYFLVITLDLFVYELPLTSLNATINQLYFGNVTPKAMKDKWPNFWNDVCFKRIHPNIYNGFTVRDSDSQYVVLTIPKEKDAEKQGGCTFDINKNVVVPKRNFVYVGHRKDLRLISADTPAGYYGISKNPDGVLGIDKYQFCYTCGDKYCPGATLRKASLISPGCAWPTYYPMCAEGSTKLTIARDNSSGSLKKCPKAITWNIFTGFVDGSKFYFLGANYVFIFTEKAWTTKGVPVSLQAVSFGSFINCDGVAQARDLGVSKKSPVRFGLLVAIILIIVLLILCCILCLMREAMERRKKKKGGKGSKGGSSKGGASSWLPESLGGSSAKPGSARSSGLPGFGMLTGRKPGSSHKPNRSNKSKRSGKLPLADPLDKNSAPGTKRSAGGPSHGRSLSKKGAPGTKRSGAVGPDGSISRKGPGTKRSAPDGPPGSISQKGGPSTKRSAPVGPGGSISQKGGPSTKRSAPVGPGGSISRKGGSSGGGPSGGRSKGRNGRPSGGRSQSSGASNRTGGTKQGGSSSSKKRGPSGASGSNNATGRSGLPNRTTASGSRKRSTSRGASNKATKRSSLRK